MSKKRSVVTELEDSQKKPKVDKKPDKILEQHDGEDFVFYDKVITIREDIDDFSVRKKILEKPEEKELCRLFDNLNLRKSNIQTVSRSFYVLIS